VQATANVATANQGDEYFDIVKRIKAGDFGDADYVLYGVLTEVSSTDNVADISGTKSTSQRMTLEVAVDFHIVVMPRLHKLLLHLSPLERVRMCKLMVRILLMNLAWQN